ncbi:MAG: HAD family hydrolase [Actinomycetota bacterium]|nr:HAD family hydrolase [Actinomycetota bacterium]
MSIEAVLFDFGHTLMDFGRTEEALRGAYGTIRARLAHWVEDRSPPEVDELVERIAEEIDRMVERSYQERVLEELDILGLFDDAFMSLGYRLPRELLREVAELDHDALVRSVRIAPETIDVLEKLRADGLKLGLVSNVSQLPELLWRDIEAFGIRKLMDGVSFSSEVGIRKPRPQIFQHCLEQVACAPERAVFVGDRLVDDIAGASAVGMKTVLTRQYRDETPEEIKPDAVIENITELPAALGRIR